MEICIKFDDGLEECFVLSVKGPNPPVENYPQMIHDAVLVSSLQDAAQEASDSEVRAALQGGVDAAIKAMNDRLRAHAGGRVQIHP